jgi:hypothetical protein
MNIAKHTDEMLERIQAHQLMDIIKVANDGINKALAETQALENDATSFLDMRPTDDIMADMASLQFHKALCEDAKRFAIDELQEIGYYLN